MLLGFGRIFGAVADKIVRTSFPPSVNERDTDHVPAIGNVVLERCSPQPNIPQ